jgi:tRNA G18 (ribose-2'-O)-methylase SpoU
LSFTEEKFVLLKRYDRIKKAIFALQKYNDISEENVGNILLWLEKYEKLGFDKNSSTGSILEKLLAILKSENEFTEEVPFDDKSADRKTLPYSVLLEDIRSPFNVGSIMRSAECFCVTKIFLTGITPIPELNEKLNKTLKGSRVPFYYGKSAKEIILENKRKGVEIYSLEKTSNSVPINRADIKFPSLLIFGSEEFGVSKETLRASNKIVHIPLYGQKNSINVSVAAGIAMNIFVAAALSENPECLN